ncbi:DUF2306 domain-containing protein [Aquiflexum sp.]|uniref:DUF2306 domain-containing protein n=1 Tax=Aquiflexum sp. TaxID=1872584 RepID=UPI00359373D8
MKNKIPFALFAFLAVSVGLYPIIYWILEPTFGLLATKDAAVLQDAVWKACFYTHILFGGLALLIGWINFLKNLRIKNPYLHRLVGRIYFASVILSGVSGLYIAQFATGGLISRLGFSSLSIIWLFTTVGAIHAIRKFKISLHQRLMIFSYAACFAAVTLRIWLPLLSLIFSDFMIAYRMTSWLCWVPNLVFAYFLNRKVIGDTNNLYSLNQ